MTLVRMLVGASQLSRTVLTRENVVGAGTTKTCRLLASREITQNHQAKHHTNISPFQQHITPALAPLERTSHLQTSFSSRAKLHTSAYFHQQTKRSSKQGHDVKISENKKLVTIVKDDGTEMRFNATWLRQNCQCEICVHPVAKQRFISAGDLAPIYSVKRAEISNGDSLVVEWNEENHTGLLPLDFLSRYDYSDEARKKMVADRTPPKSPCQGKATKLAYSTVAKSERGVWEWVKSLNEQGLCIVEGIPPEVTVKELVEKIGPLHPTVYGQGTFVTKQDPDNVINNAYTADKLTLHMDLPYYESPPGYQFLLCERFDACIVGGESVMVDAWYEAQRMKELYPDMFETLTRVPATFHNINYAKDRVDMQYRVPHFVVDEESGEIVFINWTEGMQGPLCVPEKDVEPYFVAYQKFAHMLKYSESKVEFRLQEGELLGWNNRRFVHGRNAFQPNGGYRVFPGCYLSIDDMKCRAQLLSNEFNDGKRVKRVFNRSSI